MGTLLRVDPLGGCFAFAGLDGHRRRRAQERQRHGARRRRHHLLPGQPEDDDPYDGHDTPGRRRSRSPRPRASRQRRNYYIRIDNEVMQVTGGQGTTTWTVVRGQLGHRGAATHASGATITALANDWYAGFTGVPAGLAEPQGDLQGQELRQHHRYDLRGADHQPAAADAKICNWTIGGAAGCSTATSNGWVDPAGPAVQAVGSTDVSTTWTLPGLGRRLHRHRVRTRVRCGCSSTPSAGRRSSPTTFSTWGNLMKIVYDAP